MGSFGIKIKEVVDPETGKTKKVFDKDNSTAHCGSAFFRTTEGFPHEWRRGSRPFCCPFTNLGDRTISRAWGLVHPPGAAGDATEPARAPPAAVRVLCVLPTVAVLKTAALAVIRLSPAGR